VPELEFKTAIGRNIRAAPSTPPQAREYPRQVTRHFGAGLAAKFSTGMGTFG